MNKKQKMILKMWNNYSHNCNYHNTKPIYNYNVFRNAFIYEDMDFIIESKNWYKENRIKPKYKKAC